MCALLLIDRLSPPAVLHLVGTQDGVTPLCSLLF